MYGHFEREKISMKLIFISVSSLLLFVSAVFAADDGRSADNMFERGVTAFKASNYEQAVAYFHAADKAGLDTTALHYNLGVAYFKLERYAKARREFEQLTASQDTAPLAHYNLGLIALRNGNDRTAADHFRIAYRTAEKEKLRKLADTRLKEIASRPEPRTWSGYVSLAGGYDDNVSLDVGGETLVSKTQDEFWEFIGSATGQIIGTNVNGLQLKSSVYYLDYLDADEFDFGNFRVGPQLDYQIGAWNTSLSGYTDWALIDRSLFERIFSAEVIGSRKIYSNLKLRLKYKSSLIDAQAPYDDLNGIRHRVSTQLRYFIFGTYTRLGYRFEFNDRDDNDYPNRHTIRFSADRNLTETWRSGVNGNYRFSDYQRTDRKDKRLWLTLRISRRMPWDFRIFGKYDYIRNASNIAEEEYTSNIFSIGIERIF